jgi:hypothetical protein
MNAFKIIIRTPEERNHFRDLGIHCRIILKLILEEGNMMIWAGFIWPSTEARNRLS